MNSAEGQQEVASLVGKMLVAKLKQLGAKEDAAVRVVSKLSFDEIRSYLAMTDDEIKAAFARK